MGDQRRWSLQQNLYTSTTLIQLLYNKCKVFLKCLMTKFSDFSKIMKGENLFDVDVLQTEAIKTNKLDVGTKTNSLFTKLYLTQVKDFFTKCVLKFLLSSTLYLQNKLPFKNKVIKDVHYLNLINENKKFIKWYF